MQTEELSDELRAKINSLIQNDKIVLFMKGTKEAPMCGFSDAVVRVLNFYGVDFVTYDILANPDLRSGLRIYSDWQTFPQLYINQEFIGGCDIVMDMHQKGEIQSLIA